MEFPPTDDSRPAFIRPQCCVGIYLDAIDARPDKNTVVGSHHAFMMAVMDRMLEHFLSLDLARVKGLLETRHVGDGWIIEGFKTGCIIVVNFDTSTSLEDLWMMHKKNRLSAILQDALVDRALLKATNTVKLTLRSKPWEDEIIACRQELQSCDPARINVERKERDLALAKRVRQYQKAMPKAIIDARDAESILERNLGKLMLTIKQVLPQNCLVIRSVKEFATNVKMAKGVNSNVSFDTIDHLLRSMEFFRSLFHDIEREIIHPLCQIHAICENDNQRKLKKIIKSSCAEILTALKPEADLQKIRHKEWESKVLHREQGLFYGLISLVPMSIDRLITIDCSTDEYINDLPAMADL